MKKIKLTKNKYALVDDEDYNRINKYKWYTLKTKTNYYAMRDNRNSKRTKGFVIGMHREIINCPKNKEVDHIDHNGLNNQKSNLRICTEKQNHYNCRLQKTNNTSGYKGVSWNKDHNKWRVRINKNNKEILIGRYDNKINAINAYNKAAKKYYGKFVCLNEVPNDI